MDIVAMDEYDVRVRVFAVRPLNRKPVIVLRTCVRAAGGFQIQPSVHPVDVQHVDQDRRLKERLPALSVQGYQAKVVYSDSRKLDVHDARARTV